MFSVVSSDFILEYFTVNSAGTHIFGNAIMATRMLRVAVSRDVLANILFKSNPPGPLITDKHGFDERFVFAEIFAKSGGPGGIHS